MNGRRPNGYRKAVVTAAWNTRQPLICAETGATVWSQPGGVLGEPGIIAAPARAENFRDRDGRHRHAIGRTLGFKPVPRSLPDHEIDEFEALGVVDRFSQQLPVAMVVVARFMLTHGTPRTRASQKNTVDQGLRGRNGFAGVIPVPSILSRRCCRIEPPCGAKLRGLSAEGMAGGARGGPGTWHNRSHPKAESM